MAWERLQVACKRRYASVGSARRDPHFQTKERACARRRSPQQQSRNDFLEKNDYGKCPGYFFPRIIVPPSDCCKLAFESRIAPPSESAPPRVSIGHRAPRRPSPSAFYPQPEMSTEISIQSRSRTSQDNSATIIFRVHVLPQRHFILASHSLS